MSESKYIDSEKKLLLQVAFESIQAGLETGKALTLDGKKYPDHLTEVKASFVTLDINHRLRGCIGSLEANQSLVRDVAYNAYAAAFKDPRFSPLTTKEFNQLEIHISVLSTPEPFPVTSEEELRVLIRPKIDGLILQDGTHKGTFLPSVWESLSEPRVFISHLKQKAGLPPDHWSPTLRFWRYTTVVIDCDSRGVLQTLKNNH